MSAGCLHRVQAKAASATKPAVEPNTDHARSSRGGITVRTAPAPTLSAGEGTGRGRTAVDWYSETTVAAAVTTMPMPNTAG